MIKKSLAAVAVIVVALAAGAYFAMRARARHTGDRLVAKALEVDGTTFVRRSHAPEPGAVGDKLAVLLRRRAADKAWTDERSLVARAERAHQALSS